MTALCYPRIGSRYEYTLGGGVSYRLGIKEDFGAMGINIESYYYFVDQFRAGLDLHYYLVDFDFSPSAIEVNLNTGLTLIENRYLALLGLAGFQFIWIDYDWDNEVFGNDRHYGLGLNLGANVEYDIDFFKIFVEPKMTLYAVNEFRITPSFTFGVRYFF